VLYKFIALKLYSKKVSRVVSRWKNTLPAGMQDYLFDECYNKIEVENKLRKLFYQSGYNEIQTPLLEYYDVFTGIKASIDQEQMFKLFDADGRILVLRPDITMPIARIAATKLKDLCFPLRISYIGNVYRNLVTQSGKQSEIAQAGLELIGASNAEADAEVIATAIQAFIDLDIKEFQLDLGQVEFFKGIIEQTGIDAELEDEIRSLIERKNMLELELLLKTIQISDDLKNTIYDLPKLYGNGDMLKKAAKLSNSARCDKALENIRSVHDILRDFGFDRFLTFDLGMVQSFNFYTGIIFRGITADLGYPICGGGRYDRLVQEFGIDMPATGFAVGIKRVLIVLERQKSLKNIPGIDILVVFERGNRKQAYSLIQQLRADGFRTEVYIPSEEIADPVYYAKKKGLSKIINVTENGISEIKLTDLEGIVDNDSIS